MADWTAARAIGRDWARKWRAARADDSFEPVHLPGPFVELGAVPGGAGLPWPFQCQDGQSRARIRQLAEDHATAPRSTDCTMPRRCRSSRPVRGLSGATASSVPGARREGPGDADCALRTTPRCRCPAQRDPRSSLSDAQSPTEDRGLGHVRRISLERDMRGQHLCRIAASPARSCARLSSDRATSGDRVERVRECPEHVDGIVRPEYVRPAARRGRRSCRLGRPRWDAPVQGAF